MKLGRPREFDRDQALESAMRLFWEKGFEGTSKRDLMAATGIASQSLYNAFGDKRELFRQALSHYVETRMTGLVDALNAPGSPLQNLRQFLGGLVTTPEESPKGCLVCNSMAEFGQGDSEIVDFLRAQLDRVQAVFAETLARARDAEELNPGADPGAMASFLVATMNGLFLLQRSGVPDEMRERVIHETLRWLESSQSAS